MAKRSDYKAVFLLLVFTFIALHFIIPHFFSYISFSDNFDNHLNNGNLMHCLESIKKLDLSGLYHYQFYYPYGYVSTAGTMFLGQAILVLPFYLLGIENIYFFNNILVFLAYFSGGLAVYFLAKELIADYYSALAAGIIFILAPVKHQNLPHLNLLYFSLSIFCILYLFRFLRKKHFSDLILFGIFYFAQSLFDLSYFFILTVLLPLYTLIYSFVKGQINIRSLIKLFFAAIAGASLVIILYFPYLKNPLNLQNPYKFFDFSSLMQSSFLFSSSTFHSLNSNPADYPLFLGFSGSFILSYLFYKKSSKTIHKMISILIFILLLASNILLSFSGIDKPYLEKYMNIPFNIILLLIIILTAVTWNHLKKGERTVILISILSLILFFQGLYSIVPFEFNLFRLLSYHSSFFSRLRGIKLHYFFLMFWIVFAACGIKTLRTSGSKKLFYFVLMLLIAESIPYNTRSGKLYGFSSAAKDEYQILSNYPDHYGMLELPHHNGGPKECLYILNTMFHNKQIYNGHFGVGILDPLRVYSKGYFLGVNKICIDINDNEALNYLRDKGIFIIVVHKKGLILRPSQLYLWNSLIKSFQKSCSSGMLQDLHISEDFIIGILSRKESGDSFQYILPYRYFRKKRRIIYRISNSFTDNRLEFLLNEDMLGSFIINKGASQLEISIRPDLLSPAENCLQIRCSKEIKIESIMIY